MLEYNVRYCAECASSGEPLDWGFDSMELKSDLLRKAMYEEAADWHPFIRALAGELVNTLG